MKNIFIKTEFITLGQFLKFAGIISNGGEAKMFLDSNEILVDSMQEKRRGKKLFPNSIVSINDEKYIVRNK